MHVASLTDNKMDEKLLKSFEDKVRAEAVCGRLERAGIRYRMVPTQSVDNEDVTEYGIYVREKDYKRARDAAQNPKWDEQGKEPVFHTKSESDFWFTRYSEKAAKIILWVLVLGAIIASIVSLFVDVYPTENTEKEEKEVIEHIQSGENPSDASPHSSL